MNRGAWQVTQSMGLQTVGHDWATNTFTFSHTQRSAKLLNLGYLVFFNLQKNLPALCCKTSV